MEITCCLKESNSERVSASDFAITGMILTLFPTDFIRRISRSFSLHDNGKFAAHLPMASGRDKIQEHMNSRILVLPNSIYSRFLCQELVVLLLNIFKNGSASRPLFNIVFLPLWIAKRLPKPGSIDNRNVQFFWALVWLCNVKVKDNTHIPYKYGTNRTGSILSKSRSISASSRGGITIESNSVLMNVAFPRPDCPWKYKNCTYQLSSS